MENPATWGEAEKIISRTLDAHAEVMEQNICGFSLERCIADALRKAGLLRESAHCASCDGHACEED